MSLMKKKTVFLYILGQITPTFLMGIAIFIFILLMFRFIKLIEVFLLHDVSIVSIGAILVHLSLSFLPLILPMSLLFAVLLTYSKLSANSEVVALKALGYNPSYLSLPAIFFSLLITVVSMQTQFTLGPVARLQFDKMLDKIKGQKAISAIQPGTFTKNPGKFVIYTNEVDEKTKKMNKLFVFDLRDKTNPSAIVADKGALNSTVGEHQQSEEILLTDGSIYQMGRISNTMVKFKDYKISNSRPVLDDYNSSDLDTMTISRLYKKREQSDDTKKINIEIYRRWTIALSCLIFGFLGSALGSRTNRRSNASSGFVVSVLCIISYWIFYMIGMNLSKVSQLPPAIVLQLPNLLFSAVTVWAWKSQYKLN